MLESICVNCEEEEEQDTCVKRSVFVLVAIASRVSSVQGLHHQHTDGELGCFLSQVKTSKLPTLWKGEIHRKCLIENCAKDEGWIFVCVCVIKVWSFDCALEESSFVGAWWGRKRRIRVRGIQRFSLRNSLGLFPFAAAIGWILRSQQKRSFC